MILHIDGLHAIVTGSSANVKPAGYLRLNIKADYYERGDLLKILILGGYGVFGGRLAELLSDLTNIKVLICGRNLKRAQEFCDVYEGKAVVRPLQLDRNNIVATLHAEQPDIVVDASGPFQAYGDDRYGVVEACIVAGIHYLDFADAADFVFGISRFDKAAKAAGVFVLSGVSSFPVLTAAVLREMSKTMSIVEVEGGIAPSPFAGIGLNVMRAVVGYAGSPVTLQRGGKQTTGVGLAESMRFTIAVPGKMPLRNIHFSLVDVPDLQVIPPEHATLKDIWMGAGPVPEILHRLLNCMAKIRYHFGLPSMVSLSRLFYTVLNLMKFGEHRGGMFVRARGSNDGQEIEQTWHLLAEGDEGPYIPSMAIEAIIRKYIKGEWPEHGARPGTQALELSDYEKLFQGRTIHTGFRTEERQSPLYRQVLGSAFDTLPMQVQNLHGTSNARRWFGRADVKRGTGMVARAICLLIGFPSTAENVPISVSFASEAEGERWKRDFGGKVFSSIQKRGTGKHDFLLVERFGPISVAIALVVQKDRLYLVPRSWSCLGMPLPKWLMPTGESYETQKNEQFCFDVKISAPFVGLIVSYQGTLAPAL